MSERMIPLKIADMAVAACNEEIAKLKAENARLKAEVQRLQNNCDYLDQKLDEEIDKSAMLCGQVIRLTKAGDAMAKRTEFFQKRWDADELCQEVEAWTSAKEGDQS